MVMAMLMINCLVHTLSIPFFSSCCLRHHHRLPGSLHLQGSSTKIPLKTFLTSYSPPTSPSSASLSLLLSVYTFKALPANQLDYSQLSKAIIIIIPVITILLNPHLQLQPLHIPAQAPVQVLSVQGWGSFPADNCSKLFAAVCKTS